MIYRVCQAVIQDPLASPSTSLAEFAIESQSCYVYTIAIDFLCILAFPAALDTDQGLFHPQGTNSHGASYIHAHKRFLASSLPLSSWFNIHAYMYTNIHTHTRRSFRSSYMTSWPSSNAISRSRGRNVRCSASMGVSARAFGLVSPLP